jgi:LytS/YehU family sensor histidine kinase
LEVSIASLVLDLVEKACVVMESLHISLILLTSHPYNEALQVVKLISLPMILANAVGIAIFAVIAGSLIKERQGDKR